MSRPRRNCQSSSSKFVYETITPRTTKGIFSAHVVGVEDSEDGSTDNAEDSVYSCHSWSASESGEEKEKTQSDDKLDPFQKQMLREHQEALAKTEVQVNKINVIKERDRRKRIKSSCDQLRDLLPKFEGRRNDMASVLEMTVKYLELVQTLIPPQEQLRILSIPEGLYEKWQKPTPERSKKTKGKRKTCIKKDPMKTCTIQTPKGKKQALAESSGISLNFPQLSIPTVSELQPTLPVTNSSEQHVPHPTNCLSTKWFTTLPGADQNHQNLLNTSSKTLASVPPNGSTVESSTQQDNLSFDIPDQWKGMQDSGNSSTTTANKSLEIPASTVDPDTSIHTQQALPSKAKPESLKSFQALDLNRLMTDKSLGNWPEVDLPATTNENDLCPEEVAMVDLIFLSL
ncbi:spermatogenesis- and oogenesis-specific basic helix-loop-helix-containing protein 1-like isoform X2 [Rhincodon typus]|uniref:spermatogenesis- and oogenesis-specific basic helix-loop-helix-containing protein 1-like isoform X2 n=1 Tax=Rhincodon typus TaxID=259920 RepID=UPI00202E7DDD|nr:spermatogenesis- and oogenesis-specific basic helix-loop-helix-containing protein 1-like isoform X2 [Rhincodon typus]